MSIGRININNPDLDLNARHEFLSQDWVPYPNYVKTSSSYVGRITAFTKGGFYIFGHSHLFPLFGKDLSFWAKILTLGDIVAFEKSEKFFKNFQLLTPQRLQDDQLIAEFSEITKKKKLHLKWVQFLNDVQNYFLINDFIQAQTPTLVQCPGTEPTLDPFFTELTLGSKKSLKTLPTSPELQLKKLLVAGYENIFEIKSCFRNNELTEVHQPEFFMLEWYRSYSDLAEIEQDAINLIQRFDTAKVYADVQRMTVSQLFEKYLNFKLNHDTSLNELQQLCKKHELNFSSTYSWNDCFHLLWVEKIDKELKNHPFLIVNNYPPTQAALAKINKNGWSERFEIYLSGIEIANAFLELNDPQVQKLRFEKDLAEKKLLNKKEINLDQNFLDALNYGMPPCAGIAMGMDRLFMVLNNLNSIQSFRLLPIIY